MGAGLTSSGSKPAGQSTDGDEPLVIVEALGGLGNQMFQYAAAWALARQHGARVKLDVRRLGLTKLRQLDLGEWVAPVEIASNAEIARVRSDGTMRRAVRRLSRLAGRPLLDVYVEPSFHYDDRFLTLTPPVYLHGYFQSPRYFADCADDIRRLFTPRNLLSPGGEEVRRMIEAMEIPVAVHVRRGDFAHRPRTRAVHGSVDDAYYRRGLEIVDGITKGAARYIVFSDEPDYARQAFAWHSRATVVDSTAHRPHEDMILISCCRHAVIANSSFSWWGAWLTDSRDKRVVAPRMWMTRAHLLGRSLVDLYPEGWILV